MTTQPDPTIRERLRELAEKATPGREPIRRWWLLWTLYGLPRCSQASYPESAPHCWRLIWPWQGREVRNGSPVHVACLERWAQ